MNTTNQPAVAGHQPSVTGFPSPSASPRPPVVVIGGGIAGLVASTLVAQQGASVTLVERSSGLGGRAATRNRNGFLFNLGPHALYRQGQLSDVLRRLDVPIHGAIPGANGGYGLYAGRKYTLPVGFTSLVSTGLLTLPAKFELARLLSALPRIDASAVGSRTLSSWLQDHVRHERVRQVVEMLVRVSTFTNDPERQSAGSAIEQLQLALRGNVLYLDGGWQTIVDGLHGAAEAAGVRVVHGTAAAVERAGAQATAVRLSNGERLAASAVIVAATPADVDRITGVTAFETILTPVRVATLDIALRSLPNPRATVAFGIDAPVYFSVHSAAARLAPAGGAVVHVSRYLAPGETADHAVERQLESVMDLMQAGWRDLVVARQYLPNLTVTNAELTAAAGGAIGRPAVRVKIFDNLFIAGDWVGGRGQLSDAAAASAQEAAECASEAARQAPQRAEVAAAS